MLTQNIQKHLSVAAIALGSITVGAIAASPASAITFKFAGAMLDGRPVEGSYSIEEDLFRESAQALGFTVDIEGDIVDFLSLSVDGVEQFNGVPTQSRINNIWGLSASPFAKRDVYISVDDVPFALGLDFDAETCLVGECTGVVSWFAGGYPYGEIVQTPVFEDKVETVEPASAIAFGLVGALLLSRQRKKSSEQSA